MDSPYAYLAHNGMKPAEVLISSERIARRIRQLADEIAIDYNQHPQHPRVMLSEAEHSDQVPVSGDPHLHDESCESVPELTIIAVMTGALLMTADLVRALPHMIRIHLLDVTSYHGASTSGGELVFNSRLAAEQVAGNHVLILDDVLDSGRTLGALVQRVRKAGASSVKTCVLVSKPTATRQEGKQSEITGEGGVFDYERNLVVSADYVGFEIPDEFVVGYGMDYDDKYRNLPDICVLRRME